MNTNKKFTIGIIVLALVIVVFGIVKGNNQYKEEGPDLASQNNEGGEQCIITISGSKYDVTNFRYEHEGGNVFKCGEDMTEAFQKKHKGYLPMIEKFKIEK